MSVKRARSGRGYEARWRENGHQRQATFRTKRDAEEAERLGLDRQRSRKHGLPVDRGPIRFDELCDSYLAQHQVSPRSLRTLRERLVYSRRAFGELPVREILTEEIGAWNAGLQLGDTMRGHALRAMRQVLEAGVRWAYLAHNPAASHLVRTARPSQTEVLPLESWAEVDAVADAAGAYGPLVRFVCATGLRPQEWQVLQWADLDLASGTCRVSRTLREGRTVPLGKTDRSLRTIELQDRAIDALDPLPRPIDRRWLVFAAAVGGVIDLGNFRRRIWQPALDAAGLPYRPPYQMRHTFATLALSAGVRMEWVADQLGHADTRITQRHYARFLPAADELALRALNMFARTKRAQPERDQG